MGATTPRRMPLWQPREPEKTNVAQFMRHVNKKRNLNMRSYEELHSWSIHHSTLQDFWADAYEWLRLAPDGSQAKGRMLDAKVMPSFPRDHRLVLCSEEHILTSLS